MTEDVKGFIKFYFPICILLLATVLRCLVFFKSVTGEACLPKDPDNQSQPEILRSLYLFRDKIADKVYYYLPSPHAELALGMVLGLDRFDDVPQFKQALKNTGTIHVVVVSGFNISLVFGMIIKLTGSPYNKRNVLLALAITLFYAVLTGFEAPVIRAWIMGSVCAISRYEGRAIETFRVLIFTSLVMVLLKPCYLTQLSFQLSVLATIGLVVFGNPIKLKVENLLKTSNTLVEDLSSSLAAQILVVPLLSYNFGSISLISFLVNPLVLWTVPVGTVVGGVLVFVVNISSTLSYIVSIFLYYITDIFVRIVRYFSIFNYSILQIKISNIHVIAYYILVIVIIIRKLFCEFKNYKN